MNGLIVQKYGGTSVANPERIRAVARRVLATRRGGHPVVAVVSALGDTTDELEALAHRVTRHPAEREMDMLISTGEQVSVALLAMAIHQLGGNAISFTGAQVGILTDASHTRARIVRIDARRVRRALADGYVVIVAGFQGVNLDREITTLGRGGSDLTAVALAAALKADVCEIYTDVRGVYTADPRIVRRARKLETISYEEMLELATLGAQVMQARGVFVAKRYGIPIHVRSSFTKEPGTMITKAQPMMEDMLVSGVTSTLDEAKVTIRDVPDKPGVAARIFRALAKEQINVDMIIQNVSRTGMTDLSFTVVKRDLSKAVRRTRSLTRRVGGGAVAIDEDVAKVSVVGIGMKSHSGVAATMFEALAAQKINIEMISTSEIKISCVIRKSDAHRAVRAIHARFKLGARP